MGNCNCIDFSPGISWVDDGEWGFSDPEEETSNKRSLSKQEEESKPSKQTETDAVLTAPTEVKIKISKKQLEKLLEQVDSKDLPTQDLLAGLVKIGQPCKVLREKDHRYWRPALQSIPEVVEQ
ncbi:hypothetical protein LUZ60_010769 [Juncus effusus]|nr:hypothetical protein LUZ60_010769 [Juncus effusus]